MNDDNARAPGVTSPASAGQELCEKCGQRPAEYGGRGQTPIELHLRVSRQDVKDSFQPGRWCEACLEGVLLEQLEFSEMRAAYRLERERRLAANEPVICADLQVGTK